MYKINGVYSTHLLLNIGIYQRLECLVREENSVKSSSNFMRQKQSKKPDTLPNIITRGVVAELARPSLTNTIRP